MTPRYPRLVSLLRAVDARQWIDAEALEYLGTLVTWINATGDGPSVNGRALVLTESGRDVLEMATELDNELRTKCNDGAKAFARVHELNVKEIKQLGDDLHRTRESLTRERDLWRLKAEWQEAIVASHEAWGSYLVAVADKDPAEAATASDAHRECQLKTRAAKAAYVAAGGTP